MKVNITIPINISQNLDKYNISSGYYKDICYISNSLYKTDTVKYLIILYIKLNQFFDDIKQILL